MDTAGRMQQALAGALTELLPQRPRPPDERNVLTSFRIGLTDDAALAMRGAGLVRRVMAIESDDVRSPVSERERDLPADPAQANDRDARP